MERKISASLWSADLSNLKESIKKVDKYVDSYHFDIMDNHYVQGFLFSAPIIKSLRKETSKSFEAHLMCERPETLIDEFIDAGIDTFIFHLNTCVSLEEQLSSLRKQGKKVGIAINIDESIDDIKDLIQKMDVVVLMGTALGIKGANFDTTTYDKIVYLNGLRNEKDLLIQIDGGIRKNTVPEMIKRGANVITAGSLLFENDYSEMRDWYINNI